MTPLHAVTRRTRWLGAVILLVGLAGTAAAHHSYLLTVQQLKSGLAKGTPANKGFVLIDVRSPDEHATGMIPGTDMNIEFSQMKARHREIGASLDDHIVVYCQSGHRSNIAAETLADIGYTHVYNVAGSMNAWTDAGYPVVPPTR